MDEPKPTSPEKPKPDKEPEDEILVVDIAESTPKRKERPTR